MFKGLPQTIQHGHIVTFVGRHEEFTAVAGSGSPNRQTGKPHEEGGVGSFQTARSRYNLDTDASCTAWTRNEAVPPAPSG